MKKLTVLLTLSTLACGTNDECKRLVELDQAWDKARITADTRAKLLPKVKERTTQVEAASQKLIDETWLEVDEAKVHAELLRRVALIPTATISKSQAMLGATDEGDNIITTEWAIEFKESDVAKAWDRVVELGQVPPLLALTTVIKQQNKDNWGLRLQRMLPIRSPFKPAKVPLERPDDPSTVPSVLGFCGAGELRKKIAATQAKIREVEADAETATMLIAAGPTAEGVRRRADKALRQEREAREIMTRVMDGVVKNKLPFKAIGYDEPSVVIELYGSAKELKALETMLLPFGDRVKPTELAAPGVVRRQIAVIQPKKEGPAEEQEGHDHP